MKHLLTALFICCSGFSRADYWTQKSDFPGINIDAPFSFSIGNKGYVGCGWDITFTLTRSFWEYDPVINVWTQKADFGGAARVTTSSFSIGNKGYAGMGGAAGIFQDFWEYDPTINAWAQKANFPGSPRAFSTGFAIGNEGYICGGTNYSIVYKDLWQYDPVTDTWTQKTNLTGVARYLANCFVLGTNGYIVAGHDSSGAELDDLWKYNSVADAWTQMASFPDTARSDAAALSICDKGYYGIGEGWPSFRTDWWQYDPVTNSWIQKTSFPSLGRDEVAYFSIGNKGYLGLGANYSNFYVDFWEYTPDSSCVIGMPVSSFSASGFFCPGICTDFINLSLNATSYQWSFPGASPNTSTAINPTNICYANPGTYDAQLIASNANGSDTLLLTNYITVYPFPPPQSITQSDDTLFAIAGSASYQWYFNGNLINGATDYYYVALASGDYNVVATDVNGCEVEAAVFNVVAGMPSTVDRGLWTIFPNPVSDKLVVRGSESGGTAIGISVYNMMGEIVYLPVDSRLLAVDCRLLPSGLYYLEIISGPKTFRTKFVKQ